MARKGLDWNAARARQLDIQYHNIDPARSPFYLLQSKGQIARIIDDGAITYFETHPTHDTRAYTRGMCLEKYGPSVWALNWERVWFRLPDHRLSGGRYHKVLLLNPLRGTKAEHESLFAQAETAGEFLQGIHVRSKRER